MVYQFRDISNINKEEPINSSKMGSFYLRQQYFHAPTTSMICIKLREKKTFRGWESFPTGRSIRL